MTIATYTPLTDRQAQYILDLVDQRQVDPEFEEQIRERVAAKTVSRTRASEWIERLKAKPRKNSRVGRDEPWSVLDVNTLAQMGQPSVQGDECYAMHRMQRDTGMPDEDMIVPRGSYALHTPSAANQTTFYSVWISDDGERWTVRQYLSDERVKIQRSAQYMVLDRISADPAGAAALYGHEIGKCGICGRKLTNDESRERGIGPICAERWGW